MVSASQYTVVSMAKKDMLDAIVLVIGTAKLPFSTLHISITTMPIFTKLIYFMSFIYTPYRPNLKIIGLVVWKIFAPEYFSSSLHHFKIIIISNQRCPCRELIFFKFSTSTPTRHLVAYLYVKAFP